jgi:serine/threonine protein phosphatase 1
MIKDSSNVTVIGDVHGCYKTLKALVEMIPEEHKETICFAGDLIDRGPGSMEVVQFVMDNGYDCVQGNHEQMMVDWSGRHSDVLWLGNGGDICLDSYRHAIDPEKPWLKPDVNKELFEEHRKWMASLPVYIEYPNCKPKEDRHLVVSHSVCHNYWKAIKAKDPHRKEQAMQQIPWNRNFSSLKDAGFYNVIGHTPDEENPVIKKIYANIDTGAFCGYGGWKRFKEGGLGYLTALHVPTMTVYQQECIDDNEKNYFV